MKLFAARRIVIAPSLDGGYYAVGVRGAMPPIFTGDPMGHRRRLRLRLSSVSSARGIPYALGPAWYDVDRWPDVMLLAAHLRMLARSRRHSALPRDRVSPQAAWTPAPRSLKYAGDRLILYTRNDCELCHEMEEVIAAELPKFDARIQRIEIDGDAGPRKPLRN